MIEMKRQNLIKGWERIGLDFASKSTMFGRELSEILSLSFTYPTEDYTTDIKINRSFNPDILAFPLQILL